MFSQHPRGKRQEKKRAFAANQFEQIEGRMTCLISFDKWDLRAALLDHQGIRSPAEPRMHLPHR